MTTVCINSLAFTVAKLKPNLKVQIPCCKQHQQNPSALKYFNESAGMFQKRISWI
jgi:hypothetical protein